ncbi:MAG TPA: hypothetical protein ENJ87_05805 [Gammaproteobacteria bacterium]|nr:hypothetical protein [Gammaproteobacteria bacterium]
MPQTYGRCSLLLHPDSRHYTSDDTHTLVTALQKAGFISQAVNRPDDLVYYTGDRYLDHITYLGCSPAIQFEDDSDNKNFCGIKIHHHESARLIFDQKHPVVPRCPTCKKPVKNWQESQMGSMIRCDLCNNTSPVEAFNWRKMAGYARLFIEISDIFPKEAIPQPAFLNILADITHEEWSYFYRCR